MKTIRNIFILAIVGLFSVTSMAQGDIVSAADFMTLVKSDKSLVIIDASKADSYKKAHIKNAVNIPHATLYQESEVEGLIKKPEELAKIFGEKGVSNTSTIVVYDGGSQKYNSRVYWILKYLGATNVKLLHKDMNDFKKARVPLTPMPTKVVAKTFTPSVNAAIIADMAYVKSGKAKIIDARAADEFNGTADNSDGHLPDAINIDYVEFLDANKAFKSKAEMEKVVGKYGITAETPVVAYCRTSVRATVVYAAFVNVLGYKNVKVYDGAYLEWVAKGNPLETKVGVATQKANKPSPSGGGC